MKTIKDILDQFGYEVELNADQKCDVHGKVHELGFYVEGDWHQSVACFICLECIKELIEALKCQ